MKVISIIFRNRKNPEAIKFIRQNFERIFEDYITVENCYLDEVPPGETISADAYLVSYEDMLYPLKKHIINFSKIIIMNRSINRQYLPEILEIPKDTDVLVVNDSYETTIQTTHAFYELGIGHLNLIPYDESLEHTGIYRSIKTAITPNEEYLVPPYIERVINIGYREISFDTLMKLMRKLDLDSERINRNLIRHIHTVVEPNTDFHTNYIENFLKGQMLNRVIHDSNSAIIVLDDKYRIVYSNERANSVFRIGDGLAAEIGSLIDPALLHGADTKDQLISLYDENYLFEKSTLMLMDEVMGYCVILQNEKDLRDIGINLNSRLREKGLYAKYYFRDIIHRSAAMKQCIDMAKKVAITDYTILISGESGTGKELLAQSVHNYSKRKNSPFVAVNCAALPETLLESELFGYEGGSFTGARRNGKPGLFEQADGGTVFLDEIGDISPNLQSRLLRIIQEKQIMRIGSDKVINVDIRIIAATNKDLAEEVHAGRFRSDLYFRLNVIPLIIPSLRERKEDVIPLLSHILKGDYRNVSEEEKRLLLRYDWPGNVRELESASVYYKTMGCFPPHIRFTDAAAGKVAAANTADNAAESAGSKAARRSARPGRASLFRAESAASAACLPQNLKTPDSAKAAMLRIIRDNSETYHGIGNTSLTEHMKAEGFPMGYGKMRELVNELAREGLITVCKGRKGTQITEMGICRLESGE